MKKLLIIGVATMLLVPLVLLAETYQFIISGDPVAAATVNSSTAETPSTSLVTSSRTDPTVAASIEARYRTVAPTIGIKLRSDAARGMMIIVQ